jgi:hypothetical protein
MGADVRQREDRRFDFGLIASQETEELDRGGDPLARQSLQGSEWFGIVLLVSQHEKIVRDTIRRVTPGVLVGVLTEKISHA